MLMLSESDRQVTQKLAPQLAEVEARFAAELRSDLPCVNDLVLHVERYRGKMLRPTLVLVSAMACRGDRPPDDAHRIVATVAEMVHMATLVHDDILDEADLRRRGATINHLVGNEAAVMLGDYLISHAYHLCSSIGRADIARRIAFATNTVCEGELYQLANRNNWELDEATYYEIIRRKTASLCGECCRVAAFLCDDDMTSAELGRTAEALYTYGEKLGIAFQIVDDMLDLTGDAATVGKTLGRDLDKGKLTLPLIHFLSRAEGATRAQTLDLLHRRAGAETDEAFRLASLERLRAALSDSGAVAYARTAAERLIAEAKAALADNLPPGAARATLDRMADAVLTRNF